MSNILVVLSGGQDSTTSLFWAIREWPEVKVLALTFDYGQRHQMEIEAAIKIAKMTGSEHLVFPVDVFSKIGDSALIGDGDVSVKHRTGSLPASFVPGRNILFLTIAGALAYKRGIQNIVTGVCQTDFSGYPDCRRPTIDAIQSTISLGMDYEFFIHTPMMWLTKAESVLLALNLPGCWDALAYSHTCYEGVFPPCEECPACLLRIKGFADAGHEDPLIVRARKEGK